MRTLLSVAPFLSGGVGRLDVPTTEVGDTGRPVLEKGKTPSGVCSYLTASSPASCGGAHAAEALHLAGRDGVVVVRVGVGLACRRNASRRLSRCRRSGCVAGPSRGFGEFLGCLSLPPLTSEQFGANRVPA